MGEYTFTYAFGHMTLITHHNAHARLLGLR